MSALRELSAWFTPKASTGALAICREVAYQRTGQMRRAPWLRHAKPGSTPCRPVRNTSSRVQANPCSPCRHVARTERRMMAVAETSPGANVIHT
jgi:hypothetical protein